MAYTKPQYKLAARVISIVAAVGIALTWLALPLQAATPPLLEDMVIPSERSFHVYIIDGGETIPVVSTWGFSVQNVLDRANVVLGEEDVITHMLHRPVNPDDVIRIERWVRDEFSVLEEVPYEVTQIASSLFAAGRVIPAGDGLPGLRERVYTRLLVDGVVREQTLASEVVIREPVDGRVLVGTPGARISPLNFDWRRDYNGMPVNYVSRLTGQRATGYSDRVGTITSTGQRAAVGLVAVNPNRIPYGTLLYIVSACGTFNYGYAIAADTGTSLMRGIIDVDLFYDSHFESVQNGVRIVDIFILQLP